MSPYRTGAEMPKEEVTPRPRRPWWRTDRKVMAIIIACGISSNVGALLMYWNELTLARIGAAVMTNSLVGLVLGIGYVTFPRFGPEYEDAE